MITSMRHCALLNFVFLVEMGFHHVGQAGLELLTSGDPPALASQNAGMTGVSHCARRNHHFSIPFPPAGVPHLGTNGGWHSNLQKCRETRRAFLGGRKINSTDSRTREQEGSASVATRKDKWLLSVDSFKA